MLVFLRARATRIGLAVLGVGVCFFLLTTVDGMLSQMRNEVNRDLARFQGKVLLQQPGSGYPPFSSRIEQVTVRDVLQRADVDTLSSTPLLLAVIEPPDNPLDASQVMGIGLQPGRERAYLAGVKTIKGSATLREDGEAILGSQAAHFYRVSDLDQEIVIHGHHWRVAGLLEQTGVTNVDSIVLMSLPSAQTAFGSTQFISALLLTPRDSNQDEILATALESKYPPLEAATQKVLLTRALKAMELPDKFLGLISWTVLLVAFVLATNVMIILVRERAGELKSIQSLANNPRRILTTTVSETAGLGLVGGVLGTAAAIPAAFALDWTWILTWPEFIKVVILALTSGALAGLYPAFQATRAYPEALRSAELRRQLDEMATYRRALNLAYHRLIEGREEERKRLARELHDQVIQSLLGLKLYLRNFPAYPSDRAVGEQMNVEINGIIDGIRQICTNLRPPALDHFGLASALRSHARQFQTQTGLTVDLQIDGDEQRYSEEVEVALFRVAQEALANVWTHAAATQVALHLTTGSDGLHLTIRDDGKGFNITPLIGMSDEQNHFGLITMRERVALIGGTLNIHSQPGHGTLVEAYVPANPNGPGQSDVRLENLSPLP